MKRKNDIVLKFEKNRLTILPSHCLNVSIGGWHWYSMPSAPTVVNLRGAPDGVSDGPRSSGATRPRLADGSPSCSRKPPDCRVQARLKVNKRGCCSIVKNIKYWWHLISNLLVWMWFRLGTSSWVICATFGPKLVSSVSPVAFLAAISLASPISHLWILYLPRKNGMNTKN